MANFFEDNDDLRWYVDHGIDWDPLVRATEWNFKAEDAPASAEEAVDNYRDFLQMIGEFVAEEIAPYSEELDSQHAKVVDGEAVFGERMQTIFDRIQELDLHWLTLPRELGGMNSPLLVYFLGAELMARADQSVVTHYGFHGGMAMAMLVFSIREGSTRFDPEAGGIAETRFADWMSEIGSGEAWGAMDITEPDAGSDMARLRTIGEQDEDGNWTVTGQKIFITSGHGRFHFVIARTERSEGLDGLSFFLVPTYEDTPEGRVRYATIDRVEEKMGHNASATCAISFDRTPALLLGERGEGFRYMLTLMNNARVGVGFESLGLMESAYRKAAAYAAERPSMGKTIDRHEMIADMLEEMRTDIQAIRALAVWACCHEEIGTKLELARDHAPELSPVPLSELDAELARHKAAARRATPLLKYIASEKAVEHAKRCIQIHGGNGYIKEYGAEKLLRDAMVLPIYEGTSQIQSLMAMKDTLGAVMKNPQAFVRELAQARWRALSARDPLERRVAKLQVLAADTVQLLIRKTAVDKVRSLGDKPVSTWTQSFFKDWNPKRDFAFAMLHAERLTRILADVQIAEILLDQAKAHGERRELLERWLERCEPRDRFLHDEISTTGQRLLAKLAREDAGDAAAE
ncbi:acyl-CoA dehydrogenase family protein [Pseudenhygromyxa sp. WMMC2535]|uniref:acyl-CoA dehydrogenase family protein n=1 Tax=Pseudenhygromyxa sp. WMMC2535 TaxID=2712867 RepID=UPI001557BDE7|nr:acyl-CoA dehydrogenase family protein [Pseudenhygromyxa sp. WMMC2535]NVB40435.1 acyl-CoA dehydrogenase family protein [Pseudenhygromyxa sp. WMMC2535]